MTARAVRHPGELRWETRLLGAVTAVLLAFGVAATYGAASLVTVRGENVGPEFALRQLSGAAIGAAADHALAGALAGLVGAVVGTLGGSRARARLAGAFHNDHPAALIEDAVAIGGALLIGIAGR